MKRAKKAIGRKGFRANLYGQILGNRRRFRVGDIYEDCAYHPVVVTHYSFKEDDLQGTSMIDGTWPRSCSLYHCGVRRLTKEHAARIVHAWKTGGERAVMIVNGWSEEAADKFIEEWRNG